MLSFEKLDSVLGQTKAGYAEARAALEAADGDVNVAVESLVERGYPRHELTDTVEDELYYLLNTTPRQRSKEEGPTMLDRIHQLMTDEGLPYTEAKARLYTETKKTRGERLTGAIAGSIKGYWDKLVVEIGQRLE